MDKFKSTIRPIAGGSVPSLAIVAFLVMNSFGAQSLSAQERRAETVPSLEIGDILGAEYDDASNELLVYVSEPDANNTTPLHADDVVKMGLAALTVGNFAFSLERTAKHMEIWYLPLASRDVLATLFHRSTVEATFYRTDRVLKDLANGKNPDDSLRLGASALFLCSRQLCSASQVTATDFASTYVTFFELEVGYVPDGLRVWFDKPALAVRAASRTAGEDAPDCIKEFAAALTRNMDQLLSHRTLGKEFRRLRTLLILSKAFGWASSLYVPVRASHMQSQQTANVKESRPFDYTDYHIVCPDFQDPQRVRDMVLRGGVNVTPGFETGSSIGQSLLAALPTASSTAVGRPPNEPPHIGRSGRPELEVRTAVVNGRRMLAVSLNQIVGLQKEAQR